MIVLGDGIRNITIVSLLFLIFSDRQTDRQTYRETDRQTDLLYSLKHISTIRGFSNLMNNKQFCSSKCLYYYNETMSMCLLNVIIQSDR